MNHLLSTNKLVHAAFVAALATASTTTFSAGRIDLSTYGAQCNGVTNDTVAVNNAVAAAHLSKLPLYIPPGMGCVYNNTITLTKLIPIIGDSSATSRLIYTGTGNAITVVVPTRNGDLLENRGHVISGVHIRHLNDNGGQIGIHVYLPGAPTAPQQPAYAYFKLSDLIIENFGTLGLFLDNGNANEDGIFNGWIQNSLIFNGIKATNIGDSVVFDNVTASGKNNVLLEGLTGARLVEFRGGSISTQSGMLVLNRMNGFRASNVWFETQASCTSGCYSAVAASNSFDITISGSTFNTRLPNNTSPHSYSISLAGTTDAKIINNNFENASTIGHIYVAAGAGPSRRTRIEGNTYSAGGTTPGTPIITFASGSN